MSSRGVCLTHSPPDLGSSGCYLSLSGSRSLGNVLLTEACFCHIHEPITFTPLNGNVEPISFLGTWPSLAGKIVSSRQPTKPVSYLL